VRERVKERRRPGRCFIQMPGLLTGSFLEQLGGTAPGVEAYDLPTKLAPVDGAQLHYFELGSGDPVIFVHGSIGDYRTWGYQFESFAARYRVISYSRRYHYPNAWTGDGRDYSTALHASDLAKMIDSLDYGPAHLIGQSSGGVIAAHCARHYPDRVRTLSVCEPSFMPWLPELQGGQRELDNFIAKVQKPGAQHMAEGDAEGAVRVFCDGVLGPGSFASLSPEMQSVMLANSPELKVELEVATKYSSFTFEDARQISIPTLLVRGGGTLPLFDIVSDKFAQLVPDIEVASAEASPHAVHFVNPAKFNRIVLDFLARHDDR
jgi:non-heme chloroperoxidase